MSAECRVSLDALLVDPSAVSRVSPDQAAALLVMLSSLQALLVERLASPQATVRGEQSVPPGPAHAAPAAWNHEDLLTVTEAAGLLRVSPRWLYRHAKDLPFARKLSRKVLRFSRAGIARWLATKRYG